jgi:hypothetical protein
MHNAVYISEYHTQVCITNNIFSETINDTNGSNFISPFISTFQIINRQKK